MGEWYDGLSAYLGRHDLTLDLLAVWSLAVGCALLSAVKFVSWWVLRPTVDADTVGASLKKQKFTEGFAWAALSLLYSLTLVAYYTDHRFGPPEETALRLSLMVAVGFGAYYGVLFIYALLRKRD